MIKSYKNIWITFGLASLFLLLFLTYDQRPIEDAKPTAERIDTTSEWLKEDLNNIVWDQQTERYLLIRAVDPFVIDTINVTEQMKQINIKQK